jgi:hypothetical protein
MRQSAISRIEQAEYSSWTFNTLWRVADALEARVVIQIQPIEEAVLEFGEHGRAADFRKTDATQRGKIFEVRRASTPSGEWPASPHGKKSTLSTRRPSDLAILE